MKIAGFVDRSQTRFGRSLSPGHRHLLCQQAGRFIGREDECKRYQKKDESHFQQAISGVFMLSSLNRDLGCSRWLELIDCYRVFLRMINGGTGFSSRCA